MVSKSAGLMSSRLALRISAPKGFLGIGCTVIADLMAMTVNLIEVC